MAYAFQDVVTDALMVQVGQPENMTGRFQSAQWGAVYLAMIITAFAGGALADQARAGTLSYQKIFAIGAVLPLLTAALTFFLVQEPKIRRDENKPPFIEVFKNSKIWLFSLFLFLWTFSPSFGTPFFYYCVDTLKFT